jgi:hypothetical protein
MNKQNSSVKRLLFYWVTSSAAAIAGYYLLWFVMPGHYVFGTWFRMVLYHWGHPVAYILIPRFVYGIIANKRAGKFAIKKTPEQVGMTVGIVALTILISSPLGGMLWHYHDMQAGYFPQDWGSILIFNGISWVQEKEQNYFHKLKAKQSSVKFLSAQTLAVTLNFYLSTSYVIA